MSTRAAVAYPDLATAERVRQEVIQATEEHLVRLEDAVIVEHDAGDKIKLHPGAAALVPGRTCGGRVRAVE
jgi:uncharacterized membrane protein